MEFGARGAEIVGLVLAVAVANGHSAEQHLVGRDFYEIAHGVVEPRPSFLRTGVKAIAAREKSKRVNVAAEIGLLAGTEPAIDGKEERDRRVEELEILLVLREARGVVIAIDAE